MSIASSQSGRAGTPRRVLLAEPGADGTVGGSHQVLYDVARHLDRGRYEPITLLCEENRFVSKLRDAGVEVHVMAEQYIRERDALG